MPHPVEITLPRWRQGITIAAGTAVAGAVIFGGIRGWDWWRNRRTTGFTEQGHALWQQGRLREAELALESAENLAPEALRPRLLKARLWLATGRPERGVATFRALLAKATPEVQRTIASNFHDALIGTAQWEALTELTLAELAAKPNLVWLTAALEATRLAGPRGSVAAALERELPRLSPPARALLSAQHALAAGDNVRAEFLLHGLSETLDPGHSRLAARLWWRAGRRTEARLALTRVNRPLTRDDQALAALALAPDDPTAAVAAARWLSSRTGEANDLLASGLALALAQPLAPVAEAFDRSLENRIAQLHPSVIAAVWLLQEFSDNSAGAARWRAHLQQRGGYAALPPNLRVLTPNAFLVLADVLPWRRDLLYGLLAGLPERASASLLATVPAPGST